MEKEELVIKKRMNFIEEVALESKQAGYRQLSDEEQSTLRTRVSKLVRFIRSEGVQDVVISENKPIVVKTKGIISNNHVLDEWNQDTFNYFVWSVSNQCVRKDVELNSKLDTARSVAKKSDLDFNDWLNTSVVKDLLDENGMSYDYSVSVGNKTLRIHIMYTYDAQVPTRSAITMAIRVNDMNIPMWEDLNMPEIFKSMTKLSSGLVLVSGHVGSGKTTTGASALNNLNLTSDRELMVLTIENPVEYVFKSETVTFLQRNVGDNTPDFGKATDDAMRENADIVLIGELRTSSEMDNALRLAEIGKLVIATIHSNSVADTPERIINSFPGDVQENVRARLKENIVCIVHQNLERVGDSQFPIVEGFIVKNSHEQSIVRDAMSSRKKLGSFMQKAEQDWVISHDKSFEELRERGVFDKLVEESKIESIEDARNTLVPLG